jgi:methionine--tRNA ligase beta chain
MPRSSAEILRRVGETTPVDQIRIADADWRSTGERVIEKAAALWPRSDPKTETTDPARQRKSRAGVESDSNADRVAGEEKTGHNAGSSDRSTHVEESKPSETQPAAAPAAAPPAVAASATQAADARISIDDFMKIDLRTAKVLTAEKVPNSRKLVKLTIDAGTEQRTLVAGISEAYEPETLIGRTIVVVFNLKPAKLMGIESNGMVLAASPDGGKPVLVGFDQEVPPGARVR